MQNKKLNKTSSNAKLVKTPEVKAEVKETVQDIAKKAKDVVTKTADTAEKTVKEAAAKTADAAEKTVKEVAEKTQTAATKTADAAEKTVKKAETKVKAAAKKPAAKEVLKPEITVQYQNLEVTTEVVEERVKAQFAAEGHRVGTIKKLNIYVKPEEYAAYYVINDKFTGRVDLF